MPTLITSGAMNARAFGYGASSSGADIGDPVNYSVRFNSADTAQLTRTFGTPTNSTTWSLSFWCKLSKLGINRTIIGDSAWTHGISITSADVISCSGGASIATTAVYRDVSKFYHVFITNVGTTSTVYVNNVQASSGVSSMTTINSAGVKTLFGNATGGWGDFYIADVCFVDGTALTPSSFGRTSPDTGAWVHKDPVGITWGTNGFRLRFNTGASASDLGTDSSGNGNTFTVTNLSVTAGSGNDWLTDTPTNTYPTWNPLSAGLTYANGALDVSGSVTNYHARGTIGVSSGKWYWEVTINSGSGNAVGICTDGLPQATNILNNAFAWAYAINGNKWNNASSTAYGATYTAGDVIGVLLDVGAGTITMFKNASSQGVMFSGLAAGTYFPMVWDNGGAAFSMSLNAGQRAFANPSNAGTALPLCTANLPTPAVGATAGTQATKGFVTALDTGTNIQTTLATARAGFSSDPYVEIFKNRSASEGWRVRFSADSSNYLDFSSTAAKAAFPALVGANNYVGYALRISSTFGTATGTVSHTSGVADTVTHNLGNARCWILLKREDSTSNWFVYHPSLTAGSLLYLNLANAQTADTSITSVGANSFQIGSGVATGTYRYLIVVEKNGFCALTSHTGNSSTDGPFIWHNMSDAFNLFQRYDVGQTNQIMDTTRSTYNVADASLYPAGSAAENASGSGSGSAQLDFISSGIKLRNNASGTGLNNSTGGSYIGVAIGGVPFKYNNAR